MLNLQIGTKELPVNKPLPIGIEFFEEFKRNDYYYVDKTLFIKELKKLPGKIRSSSLMSTTCRLKAPSMTAIMIIWSALSGAYSKGR